MKTLYSILTLSLATLFCKGQVTIQTNLPPSIAPNSNLTIEIKINKGAIANFSKYQMDVPAGVTVTEGNNKTGNFSFEANRAKIVWVSIPADPEFIVSFQMKIGAVGASGVFNQRFFYVEDGAKKEIEIDPVNVTFDAGGAVSATSFDPNAASSASSNTTAPTNTEVTNSSNTNTVVPTPTTEVIAGTGNTPTVVPTPTTEVITGSGNTSTTAAVTNTNTTSTSEPTKTPDEVKPPVTNTSSDLVFKIQLGAFGADPGKAKFNGAGKVSISKEGGFYKVLVGSFNSKEDALKKSEELKSKGFSGFVVKYRNGVRE